MLNLKTKLNMKNKTSITHKLGISFYALLVAVIFCGCNSNGSTQSENEITGESSFHTITVDSCEYIYKYCGYQRGYAFSHKGNCKFCSERSKK